jgi:hypothetical protein
LRALVAQQGRNPDTFGIEVRLPVQMSTPADWPTFFDAAQRMGATHVGVSNRIAGGTVAELIEWARQFVTSTRHQW